MQYRHSQYTTTHIHAFSDTCIFLSFHSLYQTEQPICFKANVEKNLPSVYKFTFVKIIKLYSTLKLNLGYCFLLLWLRNQLWKSYYQLRMIVTLLMKTYASLAGSD